MPLLRHVVVFIGFITFDLLGVWALCRHVAASPLGALTLPFNLRPFHGRFAQLRIYEPKSKRVLEVCGSFSIPILKCNPHQVQLNHNTIWPPFCLTDRLFGHSRELRSGIQKNTIGFLFGYSVSKLKL